MQCRVTIEEYMMITQGSIGHAAPPPLPHPLSPLLLTPVYQQHGYQLSMQLEYALYHDDLIWEWEEVKDTMCERAIIMIYIRVCVRCPYMGIEEVKDIMCGRAIIMIYIWGACNHTNTDSINNECYRDDITITERDDLPLSEAIIMGVDPCSSVQFTST